MASPHASVTPRTSAPPPSGDDVTTEISYLDQETAQLIDQDLMGYLQFSVDQLMELAGLSVASSLAAEYAVSSFKRVLVLVGPGNNGGDGLVAARHLHHFGYDVSICYPKRTDKPLYERLVVQCTSLRIPFVEVETLTNGSSLADSADVVVDALFGFSFKGTPRPPFDALIASMSNATAPPVVSVDVPSGWHVELGDAQATGLHPDMLVSLTAPKRCALSFQGRYHYLGGRFVPPEIISKYSLRLPEYPGSAQCVRIGGTAATAPACVADMRLSYGAQGSLLDESLVPSDPWEQFKIWFEQSMECTDLREPNAMALATADGSGSPSVRMVLMKGFGKEGITWYTNYNSRKGSELQTNNRAAATFWWDHLERQVRFEGCVRQISEEESDRYWNIRPWGHRIGAVASKQSEVVMGGRGELEEWIRRAEAQYPEAGEPIPRPKHWGGFRLVPDAVEFWQGGKSRLHDRIRYTRREGDGWTIERLSP